MQNVILVIHILACVALTGVILLQRSEGGGLGIGGGGGGGGGAGGLMSGRGAASALVRTTMLFGTIFFLTTLALTTMANRGRTTETALEQVIDTDAAATTPAIPEVDVTPPAPTVDELDEPEVPATAPSDPEDPVDNPQ